MSHFVVVVIGENVDAQLAPYSEAKCADGKWDWWVVGGRWEGYFPLKTGGKTNQCCWGDVDLEGARRSAESEARIRFGRWRQSFDVWGRPLSWTECRAAHPNDWTKAQALYHEQAAIIAYMKREGFVLDCPVETMGFDEEEYVRIQRKQALVPFAVVKDGKWYERGSMGWFACVSGEMDREQWAEQVAQLFDGLPPDTLVTVVDCHI